LAWTIEYDSQVLRDLRKLDRGTRKEIIDYLDHRIAIAENPCDFGKPLRGDKFGFWCYRVRDYRIICRLEDRNLVVFVVEVGHRSTIYDD
jgi:mRNA interferase RelE/StbE